MRTFRKPSFVLVITLTAASPLVFARQNSAPKVTRFGPYPAVVMPPPAEKFEMTPKTADAIARLDALELVFRTNAERLGAVAYTAELREGPAVGSSDRISNVIYRVQMDAVESMTDDRFVQLAVVTANTGSFTYDAASNGRVGDRRHFGSTLSVNLPASSVFIPAPRPRDFVQIVSPGSLVHGLRSGSVTVDSFEELDHPSHGKVARFKFRYQPELGRRVAVFDVAIERGAWISQSTHWDDDNQQLMTRRLEDVRFLRIERNGDIAFFPTAGVRRFFSKSGDSSIEFIQQMTITESSIKLPEDDGALFRLVPKPGEAYVDASTGIQHVGAGGPSDRTNVDSTAATVDARKWLPYGVATGTLILIGAGGWALKSARRKRAHTRSTFIS